MTPLLVIINSSAGSATDPALDDALAVLRNGADVRVVETADQDDLARAIADRDGRDLVAAGGDGSLHAVVQALLSLGLLGTDDCPTVGLLPLGTGNDFARGAGLPFDPVGAATVVLHGHATPTDVVVDDADQVVVNAVHCGVGAEAAHDGKPWKAALGKVGLGRLGYAIGALVAATRTRGCRLRVDVDGEVLSDGSRPVYQVALGNGRFVGGGLALVPGAEATDGVVRVVVSYAIPLGRRIGYGIDLLRGRHEDRDDVVTRDGARVTIAAAHDGDTFATNADGELQPRVTGRSWRVHPRAVRLMLPRVEQDPVRD